MICEFKFIIIMKEFEIIWNKETKNITSVQS